MRPIKISLVTLGNLKHSVDMSALESWPSKIMQLNHNGVIGHLADADGGEWEYPDTQLLNVLSADTADDFTVGLINAPLESNFYMRLLDNRTAVMSFHEMAYIVRESQFTFEQLILRNCYKLAVIFSACNRLFPTNYTTWAHDDIRGCLFDMNANKSDIVFSLHKPTLCGPCTSKISSQQLPTKFLPTLNGELRTLRKALYARMSDWVKENPLKSLVVTSAFAILVNIIASVFFELLKSAWPQ